MKFARELEESAVAEWRPQYLNYKGAKKALKILQKAVRTIDRASPSLTRQSPFSSLRDAPVRDVLRRIDTQPLDSVFEDPAGGNGPGSRPIRINERSPLRGERGRDGRIWTRYGSIIGSPASHEDDNPLRQAPSLELPDPALMTSGTRNSPEIEPATLSQPAAEPVEARPSSSSSAPHRPDPQPRAYSHPEGRSFFRRRTTRRDSHKDNQAIALEAYRELDAKKADFFFFLDKELAKIEDFYKTKEDEATNRLDVLRKQLHVMRNRRMMEVEAPRHHIHSNGNRISDPDVRIQHRLNHNAIGRSLGFAQELVGDALTKVRTGHVGKTSKAMGRLGTPPFEANPHWSSVANDYQRKALKQDDVTYRAAKRKLKIALAEYYRGLELLKSYALLNRTAFRKINKKYDKAMTSQSPLHYLYDKVNTSHFVTSEILESHIVAVEDLYARYFERGNHKVAVGKLRAKISKAGDFTSTCFRTGLLGGLGAFAAILGLVNGLQNALSSDDPVRSTQSSYLLQLYAGFFLCDLLMGLFCLDAALFSQAKVNYQFIFEFDTRNCLDWRQLCELPACMFFLLGFTMYLNFSPSIESEAPAMYIYWPVLLIGISTLVLFLPFPSLYYKARLWFGYSCWRLLCSGLYPVEFRDFFLGDMLCSLTYSMGNISLFFCLYAQHPLWGSPRQCNSSHSRLLGFFTTLPGIWRLLQCLRRYRDTRDWFPHLANGAKYSATILYYVTLSLYRFEHSTTTKAVFIVFATVNAIYCTAWDLIMDWSLTLSPYEKPRLLRKQIALKRTKWLYYLAIAIDPVVRFNWILYAMFTEDIQHSTAIAFLVAITEVLRRGLWSIFRIENEHCTNVGRFRAYRDAPLPYKLGEETAKASSDSDRASVARPSLPGQARDRTPAAQILGDPIINSTTRTSATDLETGGPPSGSNSVRRRSVLTDSPVVHTLRRIGSTMLTAHARDYERRKPQQEFTTTTEDTDDEEEGDGDSDNED